MVDNLVTTMYNKKIFVGGSKPWGGLVLAEIQRSKTRGGVSPNRRGVSLICKPSGAGAGGVIVHYYEEYVFNRI